MNNRKKILLKSSDLFGLENESMYINLELKNSVREIRPDSYENIFDLQKQFDDERNDSRNFTIYGGIDSVYTDGSGKPMKIYKEVLPPSDLDNIDSISVSTVTSQQGAGVTGFVLDNGARAELIGTATSQRPSYGTKNIFGFYQGYYKFDLTDIDYDVVYIGESNQVLAKQRLVFQDSVGEFLPYGNDTEEIRDDGTTFAVFNDFPFFYNIHWVKLPLEMKR